MAIVKMKKLRVVAMAASREELLRSLQHLGCVEISEPEHITAADPAWAALVRRETSDLSATRSRITDVNTALAAIKRYGDVKDGMPFPKRSSSVKARWNRPGKSRTRFARHSRICPGCRERRTVLLPDRLDCVPGPRWTCRWR